VDTGNPGDVAVGTSPIGVMEGVEVGTMIRVGIRDGVPVMVGEPVRVGVAVGPPAGVMEGISAGMGDTSPVGRSGQSVGVGNGESGGVGSGEFGGVGSGELNSVASNAVAGRSPPGATAGAGSSAPMASSTIMTRIESVATGLVVHVGVTRCSRGEFCSVA
jgi:hypothetical protein